MRKLVISLALLGLCYLGYAQNKGIKFESGISWDKIKAKAKAENKFIFMDVFATWCGPCKMMDREVYTSEKLSLFMKDKFIPIKVQADTSKNDNDDLKSWYPAAHQIINDYRVDSYPTFLFFSPEGNLMHRGVGFKDVELLIKLAGDALDPNKQYYTLLQNFEKKGLEYAEMPELVLIAKSLGDIKLAQRIAGNYIDDFLLTLPEQELFSKQNLKFISENLGSTRNKSFNFFLTNRDKINTTLTKNVAEYSIKNQIEKEYIPDLSKEKFSENDWVALGNTLRSKFGVLGQEVLFKRRLYYAYDTKDWQNYGKYYVLYFKTALERPDFPINDVSWRLFENVNDVKVLTYACDVVMKYAIAKWYQNDFNAFDTYANLLYKIGRIKVAIDWEEKALKAAKDSPDEQTFSKALNIMKKGEKTWTN